MSSTRKPIPGKPHADLHSISPAQGLSTCRQGHSQKSWDATLRKRPQSQFPSSYGMPLASPKASFAWPASPLVLEKGRQMEERPAPQGEQSRLAHQFLSHFPQIQGRQAVRDPQQEGLIFSRWGLGASGDLSCSRLESLGSPYEQAAAGSLTLTPQREAPGLLWPLKHYSC